MSRDPRTYLDTTMVGVPFTERLAPLPGLVRSHRRDRRSRGAGRRLPQHPVRPNIPYDYATRLRAVGSWTAADARLGVDFLRAVLHEIPARLLDLAP